MQQLEYNTPYDDIWRTIVERFPHLLIPLINELLLTLIQDKRMSK